MSDHDAAPDPMDKAYAQAEAVLNDEAARAARRARVLAAVAREPATTPAASSPPARRAAWRHGGWLVAASVAGLSILLSTHIDAPSLVREPAPPTAQSAPAAPTSEAAAPEPASLDAAAPPPASAGAPAQAPEPEPEARVAASRSAPPSPAILPPAPPPPLPPMSVPRAPEPFPAAAPPAPAEGVVTAQRRAQRLEEESKVEEVIVPTARMARPNADYAGAPAPGRSRMSKSAAPSDDAARLHAAAASGRTAELSDLLADGIPVDALDAEGETALMKSIQAGQPAAAAVLRRHGASLDRRNRDGESARDMATAADDAELDRALGLDR
jgi:hypothetical protein